MTKKSCSHSCGGRCCRFTLPLSPMKLAHTKRLRLKTGQIKWPDQIFIEDMLIFVRVDQQGDHSKTTRPSRARFCKNFGAEDGRFYHWTCKHLNKETGLCMAYEQRAHFCKTYPNNQPCIHCGYDNSEEILDVKIAQVAEEKNCESLP